jgi:ribosomal protein L12E/L44/L45/RPP1/RPP2
MMALAREKGGGNCAGRYRQAGRQATVSVPACRQATTAGAEEREEEEEEEEEEE